MERATAQLSDPWDDYRWRRGLWVVSFLGFIPFTLLVMLIVASLTNAQWPLLVAALVWQAFFLFATIRLSLFPCPRCGRAFAASWWYHNPLTPRCVHCRLPKWESPESSDRTPN
jgi:hypothetical protein